MGARTSSQGPTEGGGGSSMFFTHRAICDNCTPLTRIMVIRPRVSSDQPVTGLIHMPHSQATSAQRQIVNKVFVMLRLRWLWGGCGRIVAEYQLGAAGIGRCRANR